LGFTAHIHASLLVSCKACPVFTREWFGVTRALTRNEVESMTGGNNEAELQRRSPHEYR
jgi:hypothetical protein